MPLGHGYGVLVGTLDGYRRDDPDNQGRWFHDNLTVIAPAGTAPTGTAPTGTAPADGSATATYRAAVDVDSHQSATGVQWKVVRVEAGDLGPAAGLPPGYHALTSAPATGALDHVRGVFAPEWRWGRRRIRILWFTLTVPVLVHQPWSSGTNVDAATALEGILVIGSRVLVWGEPFTAGLGMHDVHQNQGDPAGSQWWDDDGIWQDGAVAVPRQDGDVDVFVSKFTSQSSRTDSAGHPI